MEDFKKCIYCQNSKSKDQFTILAWGGDQADFKRDSICDKCKRINLNIKDSITCIEKSEANNYYFNKYKISNNDYNLLFNIQGGKCRICKSHQSELPKKLAVDHCHTTGQVRGLLCSRCNLGIGLFKDSIENLTEAINYLKISKNE